MASDGRIDVRRLSAPEADARSIAIGVVGLVAGCLAGLVVTPVVLLPLWSVLPLAVATAVVLGLNALVTLRLRGLGIGLTLATCTWAVMLWLITSAVGPD
jgi:hypothetical protein